MLQIHYSKNRKDQVHDSRSQADRYAIRYGLITAVLIVIYNLIIHAAGDGGFELPDSNYPPFKRVIEVL